MKTEHTKGEWKATTYSSIMGCVITAQPDKSKNTFNIGSIHGGENKEEVIANAKLVSSAPELLEAILYLKNTTREDLITISAMEKINNAIKKATE